MGSIFGENVNKEIAKLVAQGAGRVLSGTVTSVFGGVTMLWDMYQVGWVGVWSSARLSLCEYVMVIMWLQHGYTVVTTWLKHSYNIDT